MGKKTPTGKFRGKVTIGVDQNGSPIYKYVSAPTRRELENVKAAVREHFIFGREIPKDLQFYEYAQQWYTLKKEPIISNAARASYKSCFMKHLLPEFGLQKMKAISSAQIQEFVNSFAGTSKSQITMVVGTLKQIFSSAYADGMIERDPTIALIRPKASKKDDRRPLTKEETARVLEVIQTHSEGMLLAVLYYLGVRRGEALGAVHEVIPVTAFHAQPAFVDRAGAVAFGADDRIPAHAEDDAAAGAAEGAG
jgi:integrase